MMQWEYLIIGSGQGSESEEDMFTKAGLDGWEMVCVKLPDPKQPFPMTFFYFKRPKENSNKVDFVGEQQD